MQLMLRQIKGHDAMRANECSTSSACPAGPKFKGHGHQSIKSPVQSSGHVVFNIRQVLRSSVLKQCERNAVHRFNK